MNKVIPISQPKTGEEEWQSVKDSIFSGWLTQGAKVAEFEQSFADRHGAKYAIATTSCTTALHLILVALDIGSGDEVIVPAFTWISTANVVLYCGATPVFADVNAATFNISPDDIKNKITSKTKAIIAVHLFGLCADIDAITEIAGDIPVVEDAACAAGAYYKGRMAGSLGIAAAFSFHPRKVITTGEGGMITTSNEILAEKVNVLRNHGASLSEEKRHISSKPYVLPDFNVMGFNYRMTDIQGAIGSIQLGKLDSFINERTNFADIYEEKLSTIDWLRLPQVPQNYRHAWQAYVTYVEPENCPMNRNQLMEYLLEKGISTRPGTHAIPLQDFYRKKLQVNIEHFPDALRCDENSMAIPLHNSMTREDVLYIVNAILSI